MLKYKKCDNCINKYYSDNRCGECKYGSLFKAISTKDFQDDNIQELICYKCIHTLKKNNDLVCNQNDININEIIKMLACAYYKEEGKS